VKGGDVEEEEEGGYGGPLRGTNRDWRGDVGGALEDQGAGSFREEGRYPIDHI